MLCEEARYYFCEPEKTKLDISIPIFRIGTVSGAVAGLGGRNAEALMLPERFFNPGKALHQSVHKECLELCSGRDYVLAIATSATVLLESVMMFEQVYFEKGAVVLTDAQIQLLTAIGVTLNGDYIEIPGCCTPKKLSYLFSRREIRRWKDRSVLPVTDRVGLGVLFRVYQPMIPTNVWERAAVAAAVFKNAADRSLLFSMPIPIAVDAVLSCEMSFGTGPSSRSAADFTEVVSLRAAQYITEPVDLGIATSFLAGLNVFDYIALPASRKADSIRLIETHGASLDGGDLFTEPRGIV